MHERPLVFAALLFFAGIFVSACDISICPVIALLILSAAPAFYFLKKPAIYIIAVLILFSGFTAAEYADYKKAELQSRFAGLTKKMTVTVTSFSDRNRVTITFRDGRRNVKAYLRIKSNTALFPGDIIEGEFTFSKPYKAKTELSGFAESLAGNGIYLTASAEKVSLAGFKIDGLTGKIYILRRFMDNLGGKHFKGTGRALFNAMVFGDKRLISDKLYASLQASGLNHIVVVSGLHLSVVISFLTLFIHKIFGKSRLSAIPAFLGALGFTLVAGSGASVIRAFIMCSVYLLSQILYRDNDSLTSLSVAALVMAVINPFIIFNAGFILSVLSVLGILLFNEKLGDFLKRLIPEKAASLIALSLSAQLAVLPALIHYFGFTAPYALISNLLVVSLASLYVTTGMLFVIFHRVKIIAQLLSLLLSLLTSAVEKVCSAVERLPGSLVEIDSSDLSFTLIWIFLLAVFYMYPLSMRQIRHFAAIAAVVLTLYSFSDKAEHTFGFFDFGRQTLTVMHHGDKIPFIIDCPDDYDIRLLGETPDCLVLSSHFDGEFFSGDTGIRRLIVPEALFGENDALKLMEKAEKAGVKIHFAKDNESFRLGDAVLRYKKIKDFGGGRALEIKVGGRILTTLQGIKIRDILKLHEKNAVFNCNYLRLPPGALPESIFPERFCTGKIIPNNKFVLQW